MKPQMVTMKVQITKDLRDALQRIWAKTGLTTSQQVRHSLRLWVQACEKDPERMTDRVARRERSRAAGEEGKVINLPPAPAPKGKVPPPLVLVDTPEPDLGSDPVQWAKWAARKGDAAIAELAQGKWKK